MTKKTRRRGGADRIGGPRRGGAGKLGGPRSGGGAQGADARGKAPRAALREIERLKARRRLCLIKVLACVAIILVLMWLNTLWKTGGQESFGAAEMAESALLWIAAVALAAFAGQAGVEASRCGKQLTDTCRKHGITKQDITDYERGRL